MMRCKRCIAVTMLAISSTTVVGVALKGQPMRVILVKTHRVVVYEAQSDSPTEPTGEVTEDEVEG